MSLAAQPIQFFLDGKLITVEDVSPTHTLLDYLRETLHRTGSKEGCAEGDCGACTVVVASLGKTGALTYQGINSCIAFLPVLDGKVLFTVESLKKLNNGQMHPVQTAMVTNHGSQCGFCTPGFVMTLFAMHQSRALYDEQQTRQNLAGNLCRCTGYRPILAAAREALTEVESSFDRAALDEKVRSQLAQITITADKKYQFESQEYFAPASLETLLQYLAKNPDASLLAGGTDIGLWVTKQGRVLDKLVYLGNVADLNYIDEADGQIEIGAGVSLTAASASVLRHSPEFSEVINRFASPGIRNSGTLCGNIANGSPIGDTMPCLIVLKAEIKLRSLAGERLVPLEDFYLGYQQKDLQPGELVQSVILPARDPTVNFRAYKVAKRYDQDISAVLAAFAIELNGSNMRAVRICFGGMAAVPQRALNTEQLLNGKRLSDDLIERAAVELTGEYQPLTDMRASAAYRSQITGNLLRRFFIDIQNGDKTKPVSIWEPDLGVAG